jgi:plasmid stabilization system protein ParE
MAYRVNWSPRAIDDVDSIAAYIAQDSEAYASAVVRKIFVMARTLSESPKRGRVVPEFGDEAIREIFVYSYRIIYRISVDDITIGTVIHGKRLLGLELKP